MPTLITILLIILAVAIIGLVLVLFLRTAQFSIHSGEVEPRPLEDVDGEEVARHLGLAIQMKTISHLRVEEMDPQPFIGLRELLRTLYPQIYQKLHCEVINGHALLYTWQGVDSSLAPIAFTAHQDVVLADECPDSGWTHPPFSGTLADGYVWGRGALDCKGTMISLLEAVNKLLREGFAPRRTIYLAFGFDEENSGTEGALELVKTLQARDVQLDFLLDEGGSVLAGEGLGLEGSVALVGVCEKGHLTLKIQAQCPPGHASTPPAQTSIGSLSLALATLENNPLPQSLEMVEFMMSFLGEKLPFKMRFMLANRWLFGAALKKGFALDPAFNALTRTTFAPTVIEGGEAENVLPAQASALVNIRIFPGETVPEVYEYINDLIGDEVISVLPAHGDTLLGEHTWEATDIADVDSVPYRVLAQLLKESFDGVAVAPYMMTGATDARHWAPICKRAFRFSPFVLTRDDQNSIHGVNERLSFENAGRSVAFMMELMRRLSNLPASEDDEDSTQ